MITITMSQGDNEITRNYDEGLFASTDMERIGQEVWSMYETLSAPYNGEFDNKPKEWKPKQWGNPKIDNEVDSILEHNN